MAIRTRNGGTRCCRTGGLGCRCLRPMLCCASCRCGRGAIDARSLGSAIAVMLPHSSMTIGRWRSAVVSGWLVGVTGGSPGVGSLHRMILVGSRSICYLLVPGMCVCVCGWRRARRNGIGLYVRCGVRQALIVGTAAPSASQSATACHAALGFLTAAACDCPALAVLCRAGFSGWVVAGGDASDSSAVPGGFRYSGRRGCVAHRARAPGVPR